MILVKHKPYQGGSTFNSSLNFLEEPKFLG
jgi:hypothetical protein